MIPSFYTTPFYIIQLIQSWITLTSPHSYLEYKCDKYFYDFQMSFLCIKSRISVSKDLISVFQLISNYPGSLFALYDSQFVIWYYQLTLLQYNNTWMEWICVNPRDAKVFQGLRPPGLTFSKKNIFRFVPNFRNLSFFVWSGVSDEQTQNHTYRLMYKKIL